MIVCAAHTSWDESQLRACMQDASYLVIVRSVFHSLGIPTSLHPEGWIARCGFGCVWLDWIEFACSGLFCLVRFGLVWFGTPHKISPARLQRATDGRFSLLLDALAGCLRLV